ncbi:hypothetical protein Nepgr_004702 [Nepenthes gracilis]|uniref:Glycosyltransferase n=1 Tax=Nepenthes gracilis TaxID=150966 RepID=A0AAD3XFH7_NEPGR|nr:hypothetical protein Nepgr_004702 [Nepenthes gracilis]
MGSEAGKLHVLFFPLMAHGHMIPILDIARLFVSHSVKTTIATTPLNAPVFTRAIEKCRTDEISIRIFSFPSKEVGLPERVENFEHVHGAEMTYKFFKAIDMLEETLERLVEELRPNCLVADMFFPWATDVAAKFNIPRLVFHGMSSFYSSVTENLMLHEPHKNASSDDEEFLVPNLPDEIKLTRNQVHEFVLLGADTELFRFVKFAIESERRSYGIITNNFYELEPAYVDYYRKVSGRRTWQIGPVSLCNRSIEDKVQRGKKASIDEYDCMKWLDSKELNSVIYICFGSLARLSASQLREIAIALEASEQQFIWVVRGCSDQESNDQEWFPRDFERRIEGKGLIIRGWAPQVLILEHESTGAFVTHCGWNSTLEGISAGLPMVTWPLLAEQFYNEIFVTRILKTGIGVGAKQRREVAPASAIVKQEAIEKAVRQIMVGEEAEEIRSRAKKLKEMARKAVEEGGSSYSDLSALIQELSCYTA